VSKTITRDEAKAIAEDANLFDMLLVFFEKQVDYDSTTFKPTGLKVPVDQFGHSRAYLDASSRLVVGFKVDTLYSFACLDLSKETITLSGPELGDRCWPATCSKKDAIRKSNRGRSMTELTEILAGLSTLAFVIGSMTNMGLSLTMKHLYRT
jgi:hypothetical protein